MLDINDLKRFALKNLENYNCHSFDLMLYFWNFTMNREGWLHLVRIAAYEPNDTSQPNRENKL